MRSISERERKSIRERIEFEQQEAAREREQQDKRNYDRHVDQFEQEQSRIVPAYRLQPLTWEEFKVALPDDQSDPQLRAAIAVNQALLRRAAEQTAKQVQDESDPDVYIDPGTAGPEHAMSLEAAQRYNKEQARLFRESTPEYYPCEDNLRVLLDYFERNGITIITSEMFRKAFERLRSFGLVTERPVEPEPQPEPPQAQQPTPEPDDGMVGIDPETGLERRYSNREIGRMSSYAFKRAFDLNLERRLAAWDELIVEPSRY